MSWSNANFDTTLLLELNNQTAIHSVDLPGSTPSMIL